MKTQAFAQQHKKAICWTIAWVIIVVLTVASHGVILIPLLYLAPSIFAYKDKKKNAGAILALNLFLGWTVLGWIIAAIWASCKD